MRKLSLLCFFLLLFSATKAQEKLCFLLDGELQCQELIDSSQLPLIAQDWLDNQWNKGYLSASIDSQSKKADSLILFCHRGTLFNRLKVKSHNLPQDFLDSNVSELDLREFDQLRRNIFSHYENQGYPFVSMELRKARIDEEHQIESQLFFDPGRFIAFDTLEIVGNSKLSKKYLEKYLGISPGEPYSENQVKRLDQLLRNQPLLRQRSASKVYFYQGLAKVVLYIDKVVSDRFDGVIGLAPNSDNRDGNALLITGEVNVALNSLFNSAKAFELHWRNYLQRSQRLETEFSWPYLFGSKIGLNGQFELNKYDTLFLNLSTRIGFRYQQQGNNYIQFYYQFDGSNLITADTSAVRSSRRLPSNNPYRVDNYGISAVQRQLDFGPNPRKGISLTSNVAIGVKQLLRNSQIDQVTFYSESRNANISIYDTIQRRSLRARIELGADWFIPLFKKASLLNKLNFNALFADEILFNEYYNFGGFSDLQGFDERSIFASKYLHYRLEYRYLFSELGNIGLFFNAAAMEDREEKVGIIDIPYGFGISANLEVGSGILSLAYALGSQQGNPIQFNAAKIHFGLVNYF